MLVACHLIPAVQEHKRKMRPQPSAEPSSTAFDTSLILPLMVLLALQGISMGLSFLPGMMWRGISLSIFAISVILVLLFIRKKSEHHEEEQLNAVLKQMASETGNISQDLPVLHGSRFEMIAREYNRLFDQLRQAILNLQNNSILVALASAQSRKISAEANVNANQLKSISEQIFYSSRESSTAIDEVSQRAVSISEINSNNLEQAKTYTRNLQQVAGDIKEIDALIRGFQSTVAELKANSANIASMLNTVQGFSHQTNMLALNASVEAARAGVAGKGFAVVANEIRNLAEKVKTAADNISELNDGMTHAVGETADSTSTITDKAGKAASEIEAASTGFAKMISDFQSSHEDLLWVSGAVEELSSTNQEIHARAADVHDIGITLHTDMNLAEEKSMVLRDATERSLKDLSRFRIGRGRFEEMLGLLFQRVGRITDIMEDLLKQGVDLFDTRYQKIPNTNPVKYSVTYVKPLTDAIQTVEEQWFKEIEGTIYCLVIDINGYLAVHYREFSHPVTGNPDIDLMKSRHMRFYFSNETEKRRVKNTEPFLLQTYLRDTGDVLIDLSTPIFLHGKHFGALCFGMSPAVLNL